MTCGAGADAVVTAASAVVRALRAITRQHRASGRLVEPPVNAATAAEYGVLARRAVPATP